MCKPAFPIRWCPSAWQGTCPTSIQNRKMHGGLCLVFAFAIIPKHLQVVYKRDIQQFGVSQLPCSLIEPPPPSCRPMSPIPYGARDVSWHVIWRGDCFWLRLCSTGSQKWWVEGSFGGHLVLPPLGSRDISKSGVKCRATAWMGAELWAFKNRAS